MPDFRFYQPIEVRYGDLDPQGHVNNAKYLTYLEQARVAYCRQLGLWDGDSFLTFGMILADTHISFRKPMHWGQQIRVGMRVVRLGNKSMETEYVIEDAENGELIAGATAVIVAYDYRKNASMPIPDDWRKQIEEFEKLT